MNYSHPVLIIIILTSIFPYKTLKGMERSKIYDNKRENSLEDQTYECPMEEPSNNFHNRIVDYSKKDSILRYSQNLDEIIDTHFDLPGMLKSYNIRSLTLSDKIDALEHLYFKNSEQNFLVEPRNILVTVESLLKKVRKIILAAREEGASIENLLSVDEPPLMSSGVKLDVLINILKIRANNLKKISSHRKDSTLTISEAAFEVSHSVINELEKIAQDKENLDISGFKKNIQENKLYNKVMGLLS
jgi:hypothetical protein